MLGAGLALIDATDDLGAVCKCLLGVERALKQDLPHLYNHCNGN